MQSLFDHHQPGRHHRAVPCREPVCQQSSADARCVSGQARLARNGRTDASLQPTVVIRYARKHGTQKRPWLGRLMERRPAKVATVALANKIARMAWAIMLRKLHAAPATPASRRATLATCRWCCVRDCRRHAAQEGRGGGAVADAAEFFRHSNTRFLIVLVTKSLTGRPSGCPRKPLYSAVTAHL